MATSSERLERSFEDSYCLIDLPSEVLVLILEYLPLQDLANVRLVCSRLQKIVDDGCFSYLWARASLDSTWVSADNWKIYQRAADSGNVEALIVLAVAYLYTQGVPEGSGKGTLSAVNGVQATEYLCRAERLTPHSQPFSWVLFRPPWAPNHLCYKACVCNQMEQLCKNASSKEEVLGLHYCVGRTLTFQELEESGDRVKSSEWFEKGAEYDCPYSALEAWRIKQKPQLHWDAIQCIRQLRKTATQLTNEHTFLEAQLELCEAYAGGYYGGKSQQLAFLYIREMMASSRPILWEHIFKLQRGMKHDMRYILIDWVVEVAEMKEFPPPIVHMAVNLVDRYLLLRKIPTSKLQLLGITALVLASRWMNVTIITIREASWLTDHTYTYDEVVKMMGELMAVFRGDLRKSTICDYLHILLKLVGANDTTRSMAYYLSEMLLLHTVFGRFSASQLAASCLLEARILLGQEYPWPLHMPEATGFTVKALRKCCLMIYDRCLTDRYSVEDHRHVKMESIPNRFCEKRFHSVSKYEFMSCKELQEHLGIEPESPCPLLISPANKKLLSFLSDSCYLSPSSPLHSHLIGGDSSNGSSPEPLESICLEESLVKQFSTQRLSSSSSSGTASPNERESNLHFSHAQEEPLPLPPPLSLSGYLSANKSHRSSEGYFQLGSSEDSTTQSLLPSSHTNSLWEEQMDINDNPPTSMADPLLSDESPLFSPPGSKGSLATEEFDFNLDILNELPSLEPCENMQCACVPPAVNSPRRNPILPRGHELENQPCVSRRKEAAENFQNKKLVDHGPCDWYLGGRGALQPLENFHFLPSVGQRSTKGKQPLSGKLKRRKRGKAC